MALRINDALPSFDGIENWINGNIAGNELRGCPVIVHFWAVSCPACVLSMPKLEARKRDMAAQNVRFVLVHRPRMASDRDAQKVEEALRAHGIESPCALDESEVLAARFQTADSWPYYFLFDGSGQLRSRAAGGVGFNLIEAALHRLVASAACASTPLAA